MPPAPTAVEPEFLRVSLTTRLAGSSLVVVRPEDGDRYKIAENAPSIIGFIGIMIAFGHSVLAMSGEETLAQVNRELEHPKLKNLMRAGIVIFVFSLLFTSLVSFFAVAIIPDSERPKYLDKSDFRAGDELCGSGMAQASVPGIRSDRRIPDVVGSGEHGDYRLQRRAQPRFGRRRADSLVPRAA